MQLNTKPPSKENILWERQTSKYRSTELRLFSTETKKNRKTLLAALIQMWRREVKVFNRPQTVILIRAFVKTIVLWLCP